MSQQAQPDTIPVLSENVEEANSLETHTLEVEENSANTYECSLSGTKRKLTSSVWNDFSRKNINREVYGVCNHCSKKLKAGSKNGTSSLKNHLPRCRNKKNVDIRQQLLKVSVSKVDGKVQNSSGIFYFNEEVSRVELTRAIIVHEYPLSIVEHYQFKKFVPSLQPTFKVVCRNTIKRDIVNVYNSEKQKLHTFLAKNKSRVAITTDMWTSNQKKGYMAITAHFIDDSWKLQNMILRFIYVPAPHTKEVISEVLLDCLLDWNLDRRLSTITLDNCSTNDAMVDIVLDKLFPSNTLLLDGRILHMRCAAHILNLIVKVGLNVIGDAVEIIRHSVSFWTATPSRVEKFEHSARQLNIPIGKRLCLDCKTRWNSTYLMLQTAISYKNVFLRAKQQENLYDYLPSDKDWEIATKICDKLKIFYTTTELFFGTKYPTANCYFPKVCEIKVALSKWVVDLYEVIRKMALLMFDKFDKYWSDCHIIMAIAVVLDPMMKMKIVEFYHQIIYRHQAEEKIEFVKTSCYDLVKEYQSKNQVIGGASATSSRGNTTTCDLDDYDPLSRFDQFVSSTTSNVLVKSELDHYLEEPVLPREKNFDILSWWKVSGIKYPTLQKIAHDILAIPVSNVASESSFSTGGRVVRTHRNRLHPTTLEALMCTQSWLRTDLQDFNSKETDSSCSVGLISDEFMDADC